VQLRGFCAEATAAIGAYTAMGTMRDTYTSTGVKAPWVTAQQTAPAKANLEYRSRPCGLLGSAAAAVALMASSLTEPVDEGGTPADMSLRQSWTRDGMEARMEF
jgi:hypothetical protein